MPDGKRKRKPIVQFYVNEKDQFQLLMEKLVKSIVHGDKSYFYNNMCKLLFGGLSESECRKAVQAFATADVHGMAHVLVEATDRLVAAQNFKAPAQLVEYEPVEEPERPEPQRPRKALAPANQYGKLFTSE